MQAFDENPYLILVVYALMALPFIVVGVALTLLVFAGVFYRKKKYERAKKFAKTGGGVVAVYVLFYLLTRAVL